MAFKSGPKIPILTKDITSYLLDPEYDSQGVIIPPSQNPFFLSADASETVNYTYTQFRDLVKAFASGLVKSGFKKGDRLQLFAGGSIYHYVILFGTIAAGGVFSGNTSEVTVREVKTQLLHFKPSVFIVGKEGVSVAEAALEEIPAEERTVESVFRFDEDVQCGKGGKYEHWSSLFDHENGPRYQWERLTPEECETTLAIVNYTSGTTGNPKGVRQTHSTVLSFFALAANFEGAAVGKFKNGVWEQNGDDIVSDKKVFVLPWHAARPFGQAQSARIKLAAVGVEEQTYIMGRGYTGAADLLTYAAKFHATTFLAPPKVLNDIVDLGSRRDLSWDLTSLQSVSSSSGPLLPRIASDAEFFFKQNGASSEIRILSNYASTETGLIAAAPSSADYTTSAVGYVAPNVDLKLIDQYDPNAIITSAETPGIIHVRGPSVVPGYYNNTTATSESFVDGWYCTGDVGYFSKENGMLYIIDRVKDVIKAPTGMCIHPTEIEGLLMKIPGIRECGVVGVRDERTGHEVVTAFVVKEDGRGEPTEEIIVETVNRDLAGYKHIQRLVIVEEPLPREKQLGKLLRRELKEMACVA